MGIASERARASFLEEHPVLAAEVITKGKIKDKNIIRLTLAGEWRRYSPYMVVLLKELVLNMETAHDIEAERRRRGIRGHESFGSPHTPL